jgi:hypothetical protein
LTSSLPGTTEGLLFTDYTELVNRIHRSDDVSLAEIESTFAIYDPKATGWPSLGVYLFVHHPYMFFVRRGLREWLRLLGGMIPEDWTLRQEFVSACQMGYTMAEAKKLLTENEVFLELMLRALLSRFGFEGVQHWERLMPGSAIAANAIVAHLRDDRSTQVRLLLSDPDEGFDGGPLIEALRHGKRSLWTAATMTASRTPARFLFRGWRFQLLDKEMTLLVRRILQDGNFRLERDRCVELVESESRLPLEARQLCWQAWFSES